MLTELTRKIERDCCEELARIEQDCAQYDNLYLQLMRISDPDAGLPVDSLLLIDPEHAYLLEGDEIITATADNDAYLRDKADDWAINEEDTRLARYCWGLKDPENDAVDVDYDKPVIILRSGNFYGYTPRAWVTVTDVLISQGDEDTQPGFDEPAHEWPTAAKAQEWLGEIEQGPYTCSNTEAGAPTYYILPA